LAYAGDKIKTKIKARALSLLTESFLDRNPSYLDDVQSLLFDSLLAQGRKRQLEFFAKAVDIAADFAKRHTESIFAGLSGRSFKKGKNKQDEEDEEASTSKTSKADKHLDRAIEANMTVINALAKNVRSKPSVFCPQLSSFVNNDQVRPPFFLLAMGLALFIVSNQPTQGKLLTLFVLNKALSLDKEKGKSESKKTVIRETLFKTLQDHYSLSDLLSGHGITAHEAKRFALDLSQTLERVSCCCPPPPPNHQWSGCLIVMP